MTHRYPFPPHAIESERARFRGLLMEGREALPPGTLQGCLLFLRFVDLDALARERGEMVAEKALADLLAVVEVRLRSRDMLARISSNTVCILLHRCRLPHAREVARNYLDLFEKLELRVGQSPWPVQLRFRLLALDDNQPRGVGSEWFGSGRVPAMPLSEDRTKADSTSTLVRTALPSVHRLRPIEEGEQRVVPLFGSKQVSRPRVSEPDTAPGTNAEAGCGATELGPQGGGSDAPRDALPAGASVQTTSDGAAATATVPAPANAMIDMQGYSGQRLEPGLLLGKSHLPACWRLRTLGPAAAERDRERLGLCLSLLGFDPQSGGNRVGGELTLDVSARSLLPVTINWLTEQATAHQVANQDLCLALQHEDVMNHLNIVVPAVRSLRRSGFRILLGGLDDLDAAIALRRVVHFDALQFTMPLLLTTFNDVNGEGLGAWTEAMAPELVVTGVDTAADIQMVAAAEVDIAFGRAAGKTQSPRAFLP